MAKNASRAIQLAAPSKYRVRQKHNLIRNANYIRIPSESAY